VWRLKVRHRTGFCYAAEVLASYNEARMTPLTDASQTTLDSRMRISPRASVANFRDYWGSAVTAFDVHVPHTELVVEALSVVETHPLPQQPGEVGWDTLRDERVRDTYVEFLTSTPHTAVEAVVGEQARAVARDLPPRSAAHEVAQWLRSQISYVPGATGVHTKAMEVWAERNGVCQDLAHLTIGVLRTLGIPARYVSGYLHPLADAPIGEAVSGESHAWVQWWDGDWTDYDPTNGKPVGPEHVVVARGRDYWDVPPHKGVYSGPVGTALGVDVEVTRLI